MANELSISTSLSFTTTPPAPLSTAYSLLRSLTNKRFVREIKLSTNVDPLSFADDEYGILAGGAGYLFVKNIDPALTLTVRRSTDNVTNLLPGEFLLMRVGTIAAGVSPAVNLYGPSVLHDLILISDS